MNTDHLQDKDYLGDGVYVGHDGYHVVLWLEGAGFYGTDTVALDPPALEALDRYRKRVEEKLYP